LRVAPLIRAGALLLGRIAADPAVSGYQIGARGPAIAHQIEVAAAAGLVPVFAAGAIRRRRRRSN